MFVCQCIRINSDPRWLSQHMNTFSDILCFWPERQERSHEALLHPPLDVMFPLPSSVPWMFLFVCLVVGRISPDFNTICCKVQLWVNRQVICFWNGSGADNRNGFFFNNFCWTLLGSALTKMKNIRHMYLPYHHHHHHPACFNKNVFKVPSWFPVWLIKHGKKKKKAFYAFLICKKTRYHAL